MLYALRLTLSAFLILSLSVQAQPLQLLHSGTTASLRGLSVVSDRIIWVSGSEGTVGLSTNGGSDWKWIRVPHFEKSDFRDIEAFSDRDAMIMGITEPAIILSTADGGNNWKIVFEDTSKAAFLDAMDFSGDHAALIGDPQANRVLFAESSDKGKTWYKVTSPVYKHAADGESFFAASGSNLCHLSNGTCAFISGGIKSCIYIDSSRLPLLLTQGKETTGANSMAINPANGNEAFIVGGDFKNDTARSGNSLLIQFNPFVQKAPFTPPHGYRSCVEYINDKDLICCGTTGVDVSNDGGLHWEPVSDKSFHVCRKSRTGNIVFLAGTHGNMAKWQPGL